MTGTIATSLSQSITIGSAGYTSPLTITSQGTVAPGYNGGVDAIYGSASSGLTLINLGQISGGDGNNGSFAGGSAVAILGVSAFSNSGTIDGGNDRVTGNGNRGGTGVFIGGSGSFSNEGAIIGGAGTDGGIGVALQGSGVTFDNSGTISGGAGSSGLGAVGVYLQADMLINSGLIAAGSGGSDIAVSLSTVDAGSLVVEAGALFEGSIVADRQFADLLAIGGSAAISLTGIGSQFLNFNTLAFEPGSTGTFAGSLTGLTGSDVLGFTRADGFYVDGFTASGTIDTIGAGGTLIISGATAGGTSVIPGATTGATTGQTLTMSFASAAIGDVLVLTNEADGTGIKIDPHLLNRVIQNGVSLSFGGAYQPNFTITRQGMIAPVAGSGAGTIGLYADLSGQVLYNDGIIQGGAAVYGRNITLTSKPGGDGSLGGNGVDLIGGSMVNAGTIIGGKGSLLYPFLHQVAGPNDQGGVGVAVSDGATLSNTGTIIGGIGGTTSYSELVGSTGSAGISLNGGVIIDSGIVDGGGYFTPYQTPSNAIQFGTNASTLVVEARASFEGNIVANATGSDVLAIGGSTAVTLTGLGTQFQNFQTLAFETGAVGSVTGTYTGFTGLAITGFTQGDTLLLDGFGATTDTYVSGVGLELGNGTRTITLDITGSFTTADFSVIDPPAVTTIALNAPCFAAGTKILTTRGEIPVESLTTADHVILHRGGTAPIQWIGHRALSLRQHPHPEQVNPIRIQAGALAATIPHRDLIVSPDHALYLDGRLIPAKALINGSTIRQDSPTHVTYYHVELPAHAVLFAEGTRTESYLDTGNRHAFTNGGATVWLHPDLAQTQREQQSCAPFTEHGPIVEAVRTRILARANIPLAPREPKRTEYALVQSETIRGDLITGTPYRDEAGSRRRASY